MGIMASRQFSSLKSHGNVDQIVKSVVSEEMTQFLEDLPERVELKVKNLLRMAPVQPNHDLRRLIDRSVDAALNARLDSVCHHLAS